MHLVAGEGGEGHLVVNGLSFDIVRIGDTAYFKGDDDFWRQFGGEAAVQLLHDRWLEAPATSGDLASFTPLTDGGVEPAQGPSAEIREALLRDQGHQLLNCPVPVESMDNRREAPKRENQAAEGTLATQLVHDGHDALRPLRHACYGDVLHASRLRGHRLKVCPARSHRS